MLHHRHHQHNSTNPLFCATNMQTAKHSPRHADAATQPCVSEPLVSSLRSQLQAKEISWCQNRASRIACQACRKDHCWHAHTLTFAEQGGILKTCQGDVAGLTKDAVGAQRQKKHLNTRTHVTGGGSNSERFQDSKMLLTRNGRNHQNRK